MSRTSLFLFVTVLLTVGLMLNASAQESIQLVYVATHELPPGTHRPEILITGSGQNTY